MHTLVRHHCTVAILFNFVAFIPLCSFQALSLPPWCSYFRIRASLLFAPIKVFLYFLCLWRISFLESISIRWFYIEGPRKPLYSHYTQSLSFIPLFGVATLQGWSFEGRQRALQIEVQKIQFDLQWKRYWVLFARQLLFTFSSSYADGEGEGGREPGKSLVWPSPMYFRSELRDVEIAVVRKLKTD